MIELILLGLQSLATLAKHPALNDRSPAANDDIVEMLLLWSALIAEGSDAYDDLKEFTGVIQAMVAEQRGPSRAEWDVMEGRLGSAQARLAAVKAELTSEPTEEELAAAKQAEIQELERLGLERDLTDEESARLVELTE